MGAPAAAASAALAGNSFVILSVSVVGILAISLLLLAYYLFLTKCGLASWRRAAATHFHGTITVYSPAAPAPARRGLEDAAIRRIPTFRYRNKPLQAELAAASECAVCLGEFRDGERLRLLPPCLHAFHIDCIDAWLLATANCPLCRAAVSGSGYAPHVHVDIVTVLQAGATAAVSNADHVVIDIPSPSPGDMAGSGSEVGGSSGSGGGGGKMSMRDDQCIDLRRDDDGDLLSGVQQPMRRSMSMDSCNDRQFYLALQKVLRQHHSAVLLREDGKAGESSAAAAAVAGGSRAGGRLRRSFFSFSQSRSSRSAVLPI